ncbi:unnamed protein product [Phytophthora fragariaefolia]|uniref:Unnamed protein product n=1 Tax=Phytophthora fragariaefolia TaxID=1490495 RepID=A0A9W6YGD4_9STRA|nr:unnamed protein product [Phytophthora fragariaefolia]
MEMAVGSAQLKTDQQCGKKAGGLRPRVENSDCRYGSRPCARGSHRDGVYGGGANGRGPDGGFRIHSTSLEEAVNVALNAEFNFKSSRLGWNASYTNPSSGPEPMDLSYAEGEDAQSLAAEQQVGQEGWWTTSKSGANGRGPDGGFRIHSTSLEEAVNVALNAEFNFKSSRLGWNASYTNPSSGPEPMDLSYAEGEDAQSLAAEQQVGQEGWWTTSKS